MADFIVKKADLVWEETDAIVNPANSYGSMGGGVARAIKRAGGGIIEQEAMSHAPIPVGHAISPTAGDLSCRFVIHAPTMENPVERSTAKNAYPATYAALVCASELGIKSVSLPGMGTGVEGVEKSLAAKSRVSALSCFFYGSQNMIEKVRRVAFDDMLLYAFEESVKNGKL